MKKGGKSKVYIIKTVDRRLGVSALIERYETSGKRVAIKANYNSADPFPASTHPDTLSAIVDIIRHKGADIVLAERSGMGITRDVLYDMGVLSLAQKKGFDVVVLNDLKQDGWARENVNGGHWSRGFLFPVLFKEADMTISTCCLKTHRFGGHFTMSLKTSVGMVAKYDPVDHYNYMYELHGSPYQRLMIAEINTAYRPAFVIMDAIKGFSRGGPEAGTVIDPGVMLASDDRVALDAVGVSILRMYGTTPEVSAGSVFQQVQIARAADLDLGVKGPGQMEIVPINEEAVDICECIEKELNLTSGPGFKEYRISSA